MLEDLFDLLLLRRLDPARVDGDVHVDVLGRSYAVAEHPLGLSVQRRVPQAVAIVCEGIEAALAILGLPPEAPPSLRFAYKAPLMGLVCSNSGRPRLVATLSACRATDERQTAYCCLCRRIHRLTLATPAIFCAHPVAFS